MSGSRTKGLPTGSRVKVLGSQTMLLSVNYYDPEGRIITSKCENHLAGNDIIDNTYSFAGELTSSTRTHSTSSGNGNVTVANRYEYDHMGRKIATMESINNQFVEREFCLQLKYADGTTPQYNGNIANQLWGPGSLTNTFTYGYDRLNRLTTAASPNLGESIAYDVMGNITSLSRDGYGTNTYSGYAGNQLTQISGFTNSSYVYDANGNLQTDSQKGITIGYNYLNLPNAISGSATIKYTYDASGNILNQMKNYLFIILHLIGLFFGYCTLGIVVYWIFNTDIPLSLEIKNGAYVAIGTFVLLPIIGFICVRYGTGAVINRLFGYTYLLLWLVSIIRFLSIISSK